MKARLFASAMLAVIAAPASAGFVSAYAPMVEGKNGATTQALFTIGETFNNYTPPGILDGLGAYKLNDTTVRVYANHELGQTNAYAYTLANGTSLTGARVSYFDIDVDTRMVVGAGQAYDTIYDRKGQIVTSVNQLGALGANATALSATRQGFQRFCSSAMFEANSFGANRGLDDRIYFTGEESDGGSFWAVDVASNDIWAVPQFGRGGWENATLLDTGSSNKVAFALGDDRSGAPMYLYVGEKSSDPAAGFLARNGLANGKMYVYVPGDGKTLPSEFNGDNATQNGSWVAIDNYRPDLANTPGYDELGYASQSKLDELSQAVGAFRYSRPEDVSTNPNAPNQFVLASTGSSFDGTSDRQGTIYTFDVTFDADGNPVAGVQKIIYDGDEDPAGRIRSPDNLTWSGDGYIYVNEDRAFGVDAFTEDNPNEASILQLGLDGAVKQVGEIDRSVTAGSTDPVPNDVGNWETSGILDISELFGLAVGTLFITDVQAHSLTDGPISLNNLSQGGQLLLVDLTQFVDVPEPAILSLFGFGTAALALRRRRRRAV